MTRIERLDPPEALKNNQDPRHWHPKPLKTLPFLATVRLLPFPIGKHHRPTKTRRNRGRPEGRGLGFFSFGDMDVTLYGKLIKGRGPLPGTATKTFLYIFLFLLGR